ncbi:MAG: hypothetical protein R2798_09675 [Chitinophagales bacterium]|nr:hypothetical protein [Bacteroidota bacterium]
MDYLPKSEAALLNWLDNYSKKIEIHGATLGLSPEEIKAEQQICTETQEAIFLVQNKKDELKAAVKAKDQLIKDKLSGILRQGVARKKTQPAFTDAIGEDLGIRGSKDIFNADAFVPEAKIAVVGNVVRISFKKKGTEGVNIYKRRKGSAEWVFLARDTRSPYDDRIVLENAAQPEHYEYRLFGVVNDAEIGQPSQILEVVFGA